MPRTKPKNSPEDNLKQRYNLRSADRSEHSKTNKSNGSAGVPNFKNERENIVIWKRPITTVHYFFMELLCLLREFCSRMAPYWPQVLFCGSMIASSGIAFHYLEFADHYLFVILRQKVSWCIWWIFLGILSSVGLGTGLHTFVLYLGPHIARVTLAAYECSSTNFPEPPYPDDVICPEVVGETDVQDMSVWAIMNKVRLEAVMWGLGTAIGELPPFFVARAARLSGGNSKDTDDEGNDNQTEEDIKELEELLKSNPKQLSIVDRMKLYTHTMIQRVGFWGILACASIPNPLFDLAGITCGHFLVPFTTFFGATAIGKAIVKMHIQQIFVIFLFSAHHVESLLNLVSKIPGGIGEAIEQPFKDYLDKQRKHLHTGGKEGGPEGSSLLGTIFGGLVTAMLAYFVVSIVNSLAQSYHSRICKRERHRRK